LYDFRGVMKKILVLAVVALLVVPVVSAAAETSGFAKQGLVLKDLNGKRVLLDSLLARGPVVLNFWATWCGPCRLEMPQLQKVFQELEPKGVGFAAVSLDRGMSKEVLEGFLKSRGIGLPVYRDEEGSLARRFGVAAIPATFVLKSDGQVAHSTKGYRPGDEVLLRKKIEEIMTPAKAAKGTKG
jgi:thiol-disulfide isomerase/thioredoxin